MKKMQTKKQKAKAAGERKLLAALDAAVQSPSGRQTFEHGRIEHKKSYVHEVRKQ